MTWQRTVYHELGNWTTWLAGDVWVREWSITVPAARRVVRLVASFGLAVTSYDQRWFEAQPAPPLTYLFDITREPLGDDEGGGSPAGSTTVYRRAGAVRLAIATLSAGESPLGEGTIKSFVCHFTAEDGPVSLDRSDGSDVGSTGNVVYRAALAIRPSDTLYSSLSWTTSPGEPSYSLAYDLGALHLPGGPGGGGGGGGT